MRSFILAFTALALTAMPAVAETVQPSASTAAVAAKGQAIRSVDNSRLGRVSRVGPDGSVEVIVDTQVRLIPVSTLSLVEGKLTTSLTKQQIVSLH